MLHGREHSLADPPPARFGMDASSSASVGASKIGGVGLAPPKRGRPVLRVPVAFGIDASNSPSRASAGILIAWANPITASPSAWRLAEEVHGEGHVDMWLQGFDGRSELASARSVSVTP